MTQTKLSSNNFFHCRRTDMVNLPSAQPIPMTLSGKGTTSYTAKSHQAKLSLIVRAVEFILNNKGMTSVFHDAGTDQYVMKIEDGGKDVYLDFAMNHDMIRTREPAKTFRRTYILMGVLMKSVLGNAEAEGLFARLCGGMTAGQINPDDLLQLCDSVYYQAIEGRDYTVETESDGIATVAEIERAIASGLYKPMVPTMKEMVPYFGGQQSAAASATAKSVNIGKSQKSIVEDTYERALNGEYLLDYDWKTEAPTIAHYVGNLATLKKYVPTWQYAYLLNEYHPTLVKAVKAVKSGNMQIEKAVTSLCTGIPGTGKTRALYEVFKSLGMPVITVECDDETNRGEFSGVSVLDENTAKPTFVRTEFVDVIEHGGAAIIEEANLPKASAMMGNIGQLIEFPYVGKVNETRRINRHPLSAIVLTWNPDTEGSNNVSQALVSRLSRDAVPFEPMTEDQLVKVIEKDSGADKKTAKWAINAVNSAIDYLCSPQIGEPEVSQAIGMRTMSALAEKVALGIPREMAINTTIYGTIKSIRGCQEIASSLKTEILDNLPA